MSVARTHNPKAHAPAVYIPCWLIQVPANLLSHFAKLLYGRLSQWSTSRGTVHRSSPQLAQELGIHPRGIERGLKELRDVGLIETFQQEAGGVNHFRFLHHEWIDAPLNQNLEYYNTPVDNSPLPPDKSVGTPPTNLSVPPDKSVGPKIEEIKINRKNTGATVVAHNFCSSKSKSPPKSHTGYLKQRRNEPRQTAEFFTATPRGERSQSPVELKAWLKKMGRALPVNEGNL